MMICDEAMAGWGRTGKMFAFENFGVKPDIVSFARVLPAVMFSWAAFAFQKT